MRKYIISLLVLGAFVPKTASAEEGADKKDASWAKLTIQPGLQMWQPMYADSNGIVAMKPTIGLVTKVHYALTDMFGFHVRGTYGVNKMVDATGTSNYAAWAAGLGADFFFSIGDKAMWYNTMGLGYGSSTADINSKKSSLASVGAYFVTGFDVKVFANMGIWMDWGCQVVGPTTGSVTITDSMGNSSSKEVSTYHINPLGAGGMRIAF
jgi:opacity protein-like surface antigen